MPLKVAHSSFVMFFQSKSNFEVSVSVLFGMHSHPTTAKVAGENLLSVPICARFLNALKMKMNAIRVANNSSVNLDIGWM